MYSDRDRGECLECVSWHPIREECRKTMRKAIEGGCWSFQRRKRAFRASTDTRHGSLVDLAAAWLRERKYPIVLTDFAGGAGEISDAIGFNPFQSCLIECKASRSDFKRDDDKPFRISGIGLGCLRYYLVPAGMVKPEEVRAGWGLLEDRGGCVAVVRESDVFDASRVHEVALFVSLLRRLGVKEGPGVSINVYEIIPGLGNHGRATCGIEREEQN